MFFIQEDDLINATCKLATSFQPKYCKEEVCKENAHDTVGKPHTSSAVNVDMRLC